MSVQILVGNNGVNEQAVFYCTTTDWAFGPVMNSQEEAESFLRFIHGDPRSREDGELSALYSEFVQKFVCECGTVRRSDQCFWCEEDEPLNQAGQHYEEGNPAPIDCESESEPPAGERYQCRSCAKKAQRKASA